MILQINFLQLIRYSVKIELGKLVFGNESANWILLLRFYYFVEKKQRNIFSLKPKILVNWEAYDFCSYEL